MAQENVEVRVYGSRLKIPDEEMWLIVVNEVLVSENFVLSPGDKVHR